MRPTLRAPAEGTCVSCFHRIEPGEPVRNFRLGFAHDVCPKTVHGVSRPDPDDLKAWNQRLAKDGLKADTGAIPAKRRARGLAAKKANGSMPDGGTHRLPRRRTP